MGPYVAKSLTWTAVLGFFAAAPGCAPRPVPSVAVAEAPQAARPGSPVADTVLPFALVPPAGPVARTLQLDGQLYRVETGARVDAAHQLLMRDSLAGQPASDAVLAQLRRIGAGYDAQYTLTLRGADGREAFSTVLRKADFFPAVDPELVTESLPAAPRFCGYLPRFRALAFTVDFNAYDTDWAATALLLLDAGTGAVRYLGLSQRAQDQPATQQLTPDGRTLLTRYAVLSAERPPVQLSLPNLTLAGTRLLNARCALVAYDHEVDEQGLPLPMPRANALLLDLVDGRLLTRFHLGVSPTGYQDGRALNHQYLAQTNTHYFFSPDDQALVLIPRERPAALRRLRLSAVPAFQLPQRPAEVRFRLPAGPGRSLTLFADTVSGTLRCQRPESAATALGQ